jgi:predicted TPR repeat methyltransferase
MSGLYRSPTLVIAPVDDGYLGYEPRSGRLQHLNPTAALLLELCDGDRDREVLADMLGPLFGDGGRAACLTWLDDALRDRLIVDHRPLDPDWTAAGLAALAKTLNEQGRLLAAYVCRVRAAELDPGHPEHWYDLGDLSQNLGRRDQARQSYERYLELRPGDAEIEQILIALRHDRPPDRASDRCIGQIYSRFAESYEECMIVELDYQAPEHLDEAIHGQLGERGGLDVLELGCGTGLFAAKLRPRARRLVGIDLSPEMIAHARRRNLYDALEVAEITAWLVALERTARALARFDLIAACDTLIYFGDLHQVIAPAAALLKPGGLIAFTLERGATPPFALTDSGRFEHHADHVKAVATDAGLAIAHLAEALLRYEYGEPVIGLVVALQAQSG